MPKNNFPSFSAQKLQNFFKKPTLWACVFSLLASLFWLNYLNLAFNCENGKANLGAQKVGNINSTALAEAGIEGKYFIQQTDWPAKEVSTKKLYSSSSEKPDLSKIIPKIIVGGKCEVNPVSYRLGLSLSNKMVYPDEIGYWTLIDFPERLDFLARERVYNLDKKLQRKSEEILKDYKLYKNGSTWILQNDGQSMEKVGNYWYSSTGKSSLGKMISFDAGKNWIYFEKYDFPKLLEFENKNLTSRNFIKDGNYRYFLEKVKQQDGSENSEIENFYEVIRQGKEEENENEESRISRYFILDAGLIATQKKEWKNCRDENEEIAQNSLFWLEIESLDGKNRQRVYYDTGGNYETIPEIGCLKGTKFYNSFSGDSLDLLKEKTDLEIPD